jgi:hypothetical protein
MRTRRKSELRRRSSRDRVKTVLSAIVTGEIDPYLGFRNLYGEWCYNNAALQDLRPLFKIPGVEPDGCLSVTDAFREEVRSIASDILRDFEIAN